MHATLSPHLMTNNFILTRFMMKIIIVKFLFELGILDGGHKTSILYCGAIRMISR